MKVDRLKTLSKAEIPQIAENLTENDVNMLIEQLAEKEDRIRYPAFLLLKEHSQKSPLVYRHWDTLENKLESTNSYQRSIGLMLVAENVRWDKDGKFAKIIGKYLGCCSDEKFITARQAIQGLASVIAATDAYSDRIRLHLENFISEKYPENQQKLLKKDVLRIMEAINKQSQSVKTR